MNDRQSESVIIFSFNIQTDRLQNYYKYSMNDHKLLQESIFTVQQPCKVPI